MYRLALFTRRIKSIKFSVVPSIAGNPLLLPSLVLISRYCILPWIRLIQDTHFLKVFLCALLFFLQRILSLPR